MDLDKVLNNELGLNEYYFPPATTPAMQILYAVLAAAIPLGIFFAAVPPSNIIDDIVTSIKNRKITSGKVERLARDMKLVGVDPKKLTDAAHTAIFTKVIKKLMNAKSETETQAAEEELKKMLEDFWPYQRGKVREAMDKVAKEHKINLASKIKYFFGFEE
jgi:hypothetical protein